MSYSVFIHCQDYREKITYLKFLISNAEAGIVIGKGGCTISDFQSQSETRIQLSRNYEFFPGTSDRIIMVSGPINCVLKAVELILEKFLNEVIRKISFVLASTWFFHRHIIIIHLILFLSRHMVKKVKMSQVQSLVLLYLIAVAVELSEREDLL